MFVLGLGIDSTTCAHLAIITVSPSLPFLRSPAWSAT
jgi:hypothetical protein